MVIKGSRQDKINELKESTSLAQADIKQYFKFFMRIVKKIRRFKRRDENELASRLESKHNEHKTILAQKQVVLEALTEEMKLTRMNKHASSAFEWHASPPNRRMRRMAIKQRN